MNERYSLPAEHLPEEQVASIHEQAERLFVGGTMRFGGSSPGHYDSRVINSVRYADNSELITVKSPDYHMTWLKLSIDSPLPPTQRWPNTYIRHTLLVPRGGRTNLLEPDADSDDSYVHSVSVVHFSEEGELEEEIETAILDRLSTITDKGGKEEGQQEVEQVFGQLESFQEGQLSDLRRVYPDYDQLMRSDWTLDYCAERIAMLAGLTATDEVGCAPNPYIRRVEAAS